jgi:hypothetical protein
MQCDARRVFARAVECAVASQAIAFGVKVYFRKQRTFGKRLGAQRRNVLRYGNAFERLAVFERARTDGFYAIGQCKAI